MHRSSLRFLAAAMLSLAALATPQVSLASCIPPQLQAFADDPDTVVIAGNIVAVEPSRVIVDAALWWGDAPRQRVSIDRPLADPTVITSVDWTPQAGEGWVIIARRDGDRFVTGTCQQLPTDPATLAEVESSLGEPVVPEPGGVPSATPGVDAGASPIASVIPGPTSAPTAASDASSSPVIPIGLAAIAAAVLLGLALAWRRSRPDA